MSRRPVDPELLARYLRQRAEMGAGELFLGELDRQEALDAARSLRASPSRGGAPAGGLGAGGPRAAAAARAPGGGGGASSEGPVSARRRTAGSTAGGADASANAIPLVELPDDYEALREVALVCTRCRLAQGRTQVVFSDGVPDARLMVIGEAPGANEDRTGLPFVGQAGKLLDLMLGSVDLSRERNVYICNVIKCRPPGNRNPEPDEIEQCAPYLRRQIELVKPAAALAVGTFAARWLTGSSTSLGKLRGRVHRYQGVPVVVTYHPAALLRNPGWTRATWDDLQLLRELLDAA